MFMYFWPKFSWSTWYTLWMQTGLSALELCFSARTVVHSGLTQSFCSLIFSMPSWPPLKKSSEINPYLKIRWSRETSYWSKTEWLTWSWHKEENRHYIVSSSKLSYAVELLVKGRWPKRTEQEHRVKVVAVIRIPG